MATGTFTGRERMTARMLHTGRGSFWFWFISFFTRMGMHVNEMQCVNYFTAWANPLRKCVKLTGFLSTYCSAVPTFRPWEVFLVSSRRDGRKPKMRRGRGGGGRWSTRKGFVDEETFACTHSICCNGQFFCQRKLHDSKIF